MKVLIISAEVWQDKTNGGNVLTNMFSNTGWEFAQIYCNPGIPENNICKKYYQMTDNMVIKNAFSHKPIGKAFNYDVNTKADHPNEAFSHVPPETPNKKFYSFFHNHRLGIFYALKHLLWNQSNWKNEKLRKFINDFNPDIIFAPCYGDKFMLRLTRFAAQLTGKKVISYISDDHYTLKHFSLSPLFWGNRFILRKELRKTFPYYSLVYTMTEEQKKQCEKDLNGNMQILRKSITFDSKYVKTSVNNPIRLVYAGGIYLNRWKTLHKIAKAIEQINKDYTKIKLEIFTANEITSKISKLLNDGKNSIIHPPVSQEELKNIYQASDIALHVESFDLKNKLLVRFSFSTKIVDCLSSGCAVMAIADQKQAGFNYLCDNDIAFCISDCTKIESNLKDIVQNSNVILTYAQKAKRFVTTHHDTQIITKQIIRDFNYYAELQN